MPEEVDTVKITTTGAKVIIALLVVMGGLWATANSYSIGFSVDKGIKLHNKDADTHTAALKQFKAEMTGEIISAQAALQAAQTKEIKQYIDESK